MCVLCVLSCVVSGGGSYILLTTDPGRPAIVYHSNVLAHSLYSPIQAMKDHGDVYARVHIYTATELGSGRVASPTLRRFYPRGKPPVLIL